jgi:hypothetical protein
MESGRPARIPRQGPAKDSMANPILPAAPMNRTLNDQRSTGSDASRRVTDIAASRGTLKSGAGSIRRPVGRPRG